MTTRGKQIAVVVAITAALALPKRVPCECPGREPCERRDELGRICRPTDLEPLGVYLIELVAHRDLRIAYDSWLDCG
jgi:hypothetical protein